MNFESNQPKISIEYIQELTLLAHRISDLIESKEHTSLKNEFRRECAAFFSHLNLALKGSYTAKESVIQDSSRRIIHCLLALKEVPELLYVRLDLLEYAYTGITVCMTSNKASNANSADAVFNSIREEAPIKLTVPKPISVSLPPAPLSDRQQFMLKFALGHGKFQLKELATHFPSLSEKTVRNDLLSLLEHGFLRRVGVAPRSYYEVISNAVASLPHPQLDKMNATAELSAVGAR